MSSHLKKKKPKRRNKGSQKSNAFPTVTKEVRKTEGLELRPPAHGPCSCQHSVDQRYRGTIA